MDNNSNLEMRKIPSLYFLYEISIDGRILRNIKSKKVLKQYKNNQDYWMYTVSIKGKKKQGTIHSLVAECWLGCKPKDMEIDHIDKNKDNNHYSNLRYVTHSENNINRTINWKHPIKLIDTINNIEIFFDTTKKATEYIVNETGHKYGTIRSKFSNKRKRIYHYNVEYI